MAHVHGEAAKTAAQHAIMGHSMNGGAHMMGSMASGHSMAKLAQHAGTAAGLAAAGGSTKGKGIMSIITKHPLLVFGVGLAVGYYAHKYRKEIIQSATGLGEKGKDFVLHQKENLEDLVAECKECADDTSTEQAKPQA